MLSTLKIYDVYEEDESDRKKEDDEEGENMDNDFYSEEKRTVSPLSEQWKNKLKSCCTAI